MTETTLSLTEVAQRLADISKQQGFISREEILEALDEAYFLGIEHGERGCQKHQ